MAYNKAKEEKKWRLWKEAEEKQLRSLDNNGQVLTRMQIIDYVWKDSEETPYDRVIDVYIKELRKKLQLDCITTIRNVGYKLERK